MRWLVRIVFVTGIVMIILVVIGNIWVVKSTEDEVYFDLSLLPDHRVGLVLGTSDRTSNGQANPFFEKRIDQGHRCRSIYIIIAVD